MTINECYEAMGSKYEAVLARLGNEALVRRFALKFLQDPTFDQLKEKLQEGDGKEAFRAAHTLKGVCLNLGFTPLGEASSELTEALRENNDCGGCEELMERVSAEYERVITALQQLQH